MTYPDGTKDEVPVPVTVGEQADLYTPVGQDVPAKHDETPAASQGIANRGTLPAGTTYDWKTPVDTSTPGDKPACSPTVTGTGTSSLVPSGYVTTTVPGFVPGVLVSTGVFQS